MRVLYTGAKGQLGHALCDEFKKRNIDSLGIDIEDLDLTDFDAVENFLAKETFDVLVHCAAYTAVDKAEENYDLCMKINTDASIKLALEASKKGAKFVLISTDYVFDGTKDGEYETTDEVNPLSVYGKSKVEAENGVLQFPKSFVVRSSWIYGEGHNFVKTMLLLAETKKELSVVSDQVGSPTYAVDLANFLADLICSEKYGLYHATNEGFVSWNGFAKEIFKLTGHSDILVNEILTKDYKCAAKRPLNSRLSKKCLEENGFKKFPSWDDALNRYLKTLKD